MLRVSECEYECMVRTLTPAVRSFAAAATDSATFALIGDNVAAHRVTMFILLTNFSCGAYYKFIHSITFRVPLVLD